MFKRFKIWLQLPKQDKHYSKWLSQNTHLLYRLKYMAAHQVVILSDYTDKEIDKYGIELLYVITKDLAFKRTGLELLNIKSKKTLCDSIVEFQKSEYGTTIHNYAYINKIVSEVWTE